MRKKTPSKLSAKKSFIEPALAYLRKNQYLVVSFLLLAILSFVFPLLSLVFALIFPGIFLVKVKKENFLITLPVLFLVAISFLVFEYVFLAAINIPLDLGVVTGLQVILAILIYILSQKFPECAFNFTYSNKDRLYILLIYGLFIAALITRFVPLYSVPVPALSDPEAHAWFTKLILDNKDITYFYSPGLHIVSAFLVQTTSIEIPRAINLITQFFNSFSVLSWGIAIFIATKNRRLAFISSFLAFIVPLPAIFYSIAGKNALIMANMFLPFAFSFVGRLINNFNKSNAVWLAGFLTVVGLIHYPTFPYVLGWSFLAIVVYLIYCYKKDNVITKKILLTSLSIFFTATLLVGGWAIYTYKIDNTYKNHLTKAQAETFERLSQSQVNRLLNKNPETVIKKLNSLHKNADNSSSAANTSPNKLHGLVHQLKTVANNYQAQYNLYNRFPIYLGFILLAFIYLAYAPLSKYSTAVILWIIPIIMLPFIISLLQLNSGAIVTETGYLLAFQTLILAGSFLLINLFQKSKLKGIHLLIFALILITIVLYKGQETKTRLVSAKTGLSWISKSDTDAFSWINRNISNKQGIINTVHPDDNRPQILLPSDGGQWITLYTNNPAAFVFHSPGFSSVQNHTNYYLYKKVLSKNVKDARWGVKEFNKLGYYYYYDDFETNSSMGILPINKLQKNKVAEIKLVFSNSGVRIYSIKAMNQ